LLSLNLVKLTMICLAAQEFVVSLAAMQRELFISYLRFARLGENIVFQRYDQSPVSKVISF
jgi:hypothetical protein